MLDVMNVMYVNFVKDNYDNTLLPLLLDVNYESFYNICSFSAFHFISYIILFVGLTLRLPFWYQPKGEQIFDDTDLLVTP